MDALILSCGTGGGHDSAGKAILEELLRRGHNAVMLNPYTLRSNRLAGGINNSYIAAAKNAPKVFGAVYNIGNLYRKLPIHSPVYLANKAMISAMEQYLEENKFDIIIMPHLFPAEILTNMKRCGLSIPKTVFIATDYVCIPFTEETECDAYIIPAADLTEDFCSRGLPREKLYPLGIPVNSSFFVKENRDAVKRRLGLDINKKYILISGGSMGGGKIGKAIERLEKYFSNETAVEFIIICGSNKELYDSLLAKNNPHSMVLGYTNDIASYMKASHLFITKPGGLSSTEAAVCGVPMLHTAAIPGCETYNAEYFSRHGMSIVGDITSDTVCSIQKILFDDGLGESMVAQQSRINPHAAMHICDLAENMVSQSCQA